MDPRQKSAERRLFRKVGLFFLIGVGMTAVCLLLMHLGFSAEQDGRRNGAPVIGVALGIGWMLVALAALLHRLMTGPTKPGKRASF